MRRLLCSNPRFQGSALLFRQDQGIGWFPHESNCNIADDYCKDIIVTLHYVFLRNLISYKRFVIPTLIVSIGQPLFYLVTFGIGLGAYMGAFGGKPYLHFLVPGILVSSVMLSASFECLYGTFVKMVHERLYDSLVATPVSAEDAVAGDIAWGAFRGLIGGVLMVVVASIMGIFPASIVSLALLLALMVFVGILFGSLAMIITSFAPNFDFFNYYTELVLTPMLFFSGVFFPLDRFSQWMKTFAQFLPLTHAVNISRAAFAGKTTPGLAWSFLILLGIEVVAFYIGVTLMKRRLIK
ncbi:MAG: ABC transporter permease [Candidatus Eisenbacteria bacterium]